MSPKPNEAMPELMTTKEVATYLRLKERRIYDLVRQGAIPCTRVTGKWLFPRAMIDLWLAENLEGEVAGAVPRPAVLAGSHDPLLDWAVKESRCGLALLPGGSIDGLTRFAAGEAVAAGLHVYDPEAETFNETAVREGFANQRVVLIEWAKRRQGLIVQPDNPLGISGVEDLTRDDVRTAARQEEAGSQVLLTALLERAGVDGTRLRLGEERARSELDLGLSIMEGRADAGLAVEAVATSLHLGFVPLMWERYDLLVARRDYFEPAFQRLLAFARTPAFAARAERMGGYELSEHGSVRFNGA